MEWLAVIVVIIIAVMIVIIIIIPHTNFVLGPVHATEATKRNKTGTLAPEFYSQMPRAGEGLEGIVHTLI